MQKPAQSLLREKSRALGEWIALNPDQAGEIKALKEEEAYDELLEERRYLRRQVELINQWNEQGVLNERLAAERKEESVERGVNRQRERWREEEFLLRYEATYTSFMASSARFERWIAEGGLEKLEAKMLSQGYSEAEVAGTHQLIMFANKGNLAVTALDAIAKSFPEGHLKKEFVAGSSKIAETQSQLNQGAYALGKNQDGKTVMRFIQGATSSAKSAQDFSEQIKQMKQDPNLLSEDRQKLEEAEQNLEQTGFKEILQQLDDLMPKLNINAKPSKMTQEEINVLFSNIEKDPELSQRFQKEGLRMFGQSINFGNIRQQAVMAQNYNQTHQQQTISELNSTALLFAKQTDSPASEVGPITAFTDYLSGLRKALDSALKEVAVENTEKVLSSNSRNYAVIKIIDPKDSTKIIETFVEAGNNDYSLGNYGKIVGDKFVELAKREHYPTLNDSQYLNLISEMLTEFVLPDKEVAKKMVLQENGKEEDVNKVNTALMKMAAISQIIRKNDTMSNFKGAPEEYAKNFNSNLEAQANILQLNLEKSLKEQYDFYKAHPDLAKKAAENAVELVKAGSFNSKDFYDMSDALQQNYKNTYNPDETQSANAVHKTNDDNNNLEENSIKALGI